MEMIEPSNAIDVPAPTQDLKYIQALTVNVSNFVSVRLADGKNYRIWKAQMLCLIKSQVLLHIIDAENPFPEDKGVLMIPQYDQLVKGWIFGTMSDRLLNNFVDFDSAREVWMELKSRFDLPIRYEEDDADDVYAPSQDLKYIQARNVNVSNFVSVKLSGRSNYNMWKAQMLCLLQSQDLVHMIDENHNLPDGKYRYNSLVRGWILGTMSDKLYDDFTQDRAENRSAKLLWKKLESTFENSLATSETKSVTSPTFIFRTESVRVPEIEDKDNNKVKKELYEAAVEGCWCKAKSILKINKNAATEAINGNGDTILHVAVETGHNYFVERLLEFVGDYKDIETKNLKGRTALHIAAMVGNTHAAQLMVPKRKELLEIKDHAEKSPLDIASDNRKLNTSAYLFKSTPLSGSSTYKYCYQRESGLFVAILTKQYDLAEKLLKEFPDIAPEDGIFLMSMVITFPTDLGFIESFIYPSYHNVRQKTILRGSLLFQSNFLDKCVDDILWVVKFCNNTCCSWLGKNYMIFLVPIATLYQLICFLILVLYLPFAVLYFLLWKVLAVTMSPIKNIEKKKKGYQEAKKILSLICNQMGTSNDHYKEPLFEAVRQGIYEVVDEILFTSPATINFKDEEGYNIIQLAIINRAEKVYNLIHHIIERTESYREMTDSSYNNLVHLAGRLAPSFVLSRTTGEALQLQRELLWREEVEKLMLPLERKTLNKYNETPAMLFTTEHKDLMKEGENWMKTTAESCSITAALIVTIVFAAAITVPGGSNQESGIPVFKKEIAFTIFAVSNAFSLFTSTTALLLFLSILTARFSEKDFLVSLPRRLILGLLTLFLSTTAMIVAFGAILFLVFCDQRPWMLAPIFGFACLPISVIVTIKLPLLIDLIQSTYVPIFGKQSYLESCKINRKNTMFTE